MGGYGHGPAYVPETKGVMGIHQYVVRRFLAHPWVLINMFVNETFEKHPVK
jgi:hypothetical protein